MPAPSSPCTAFWQNNELTLENALFRELWRATPDGGLRLASFHRTGGPEWISSQTPPKPGPHDAPVCAPADLPADTRTWTITFSTSPHPAASSHLATRPADFVLVAELRITDSEGGHRLHTFRLHPQIAGSIHQLAGPETDTALREIESSAADPNSPSSHAGRIFIKPNGQTFVTPPAIAHPFFGFYPRHLVVRDIQFIDQTDHHGNLVFEREYLMQSGERCLPLQTNLVCIEDAASRDGEGFFWLLMAPLHRVRKRWSPVFDFLLAFQHGKLTATACPAGYALARVAYTGGRAGATLALHDLQRAFYQSGGGHPAFLLSNTWGDRCGATHLSEKFVLDEIAVARDLGVEVVQIDDGWQQGATVNTVSSGGVWNGFWDADPHFWDVHATRFPRGLAPLVAAADAAGVRPGLWFAPDSTNDLANWEKDAAQILALWREHHIAFFKLDALKLHTRLAETRFHALCDHVLKESGGAIFFDFDATAENRPTYWGRPGGGELFLENRYTEEGNYHPHQTLRALWSLAHHVRPKRLRVEFLNPARNDADYAGDPLRPSAYPPEYLFAITMPAAPLAWLNLSHVPAWIIMRWRPLIAIWKKHREPFQDGAVFPIGQAPNGFSWTGFVSLAEPNDSGPRSLYALLFRELTPDENTVIDLPAALEIPCEGPAQKLAGEGAASLDAGKLLAHIPSVQCFLFIRWSSPDLPANEQKAARLRDARGGRAASS
ncbi:MAG: alpha-galactosidase [Opitutaceae bacterium]|nr:alpha-galactosidase [Opitutaceae bacterium]